MDETIYVILKLLFDFALEVWFSIFLSLKIDFFLANRADPDEMLHNAAFHLGLHCLPKYMSSGF